MARTLALRIGQALITPVVVSILLFAAAQVIPGDVGRTILGPYATNGQVAGARPPARHRPAAPCSYWTWITDFVRGDWGESAVQNRPVRPLVLTAFKNSLILAAFALCLIVPDLDRAWRAGGAPLWEMARSLHLHHRACR